MGILKPAAMEKNLIDGGLPANIAKTEVGHWSRYMRASILNLYRSARALRFGSDWIDALVSLPDAGLVLWGEKDPYVAPRFAVSFSDTHQVPCHIDDTSGHWMIAENPEFAARHLRAFWQQLV